MLHYSRWWLFQAGLCAHFLLPTPLVGPVATRFEQEFIISSDIYSGFERELETSLCCRATRERTSQSWFHLTPPPLPSTRNGNCENHQNVIFWLRLYCLRRKSRRVDVTIPTHRSTVVWRTLILGTVMLEISLNSRQPRFILFPKEFTGGSTQTVVTGKWRRRTELSDLKVSYSFTKR